MTVTTNSPVVTKVETKPSVSTPAPTLPVTVSTPADPNGKQPDPVMDNTAQGLDTKKHDAFSHKPEPVVKESEVNSTSVHKRIEAILKEYDNKESEIPLNHHYWNLLNQYRRLRNEEKENE